MFSAPGIAIHHSTTFLPPCVHCTSPSLALCTPPSLALCTSPSLALPVTDGHDN